MKTQHISYMIRAWKKKLSLAVGASLGFLTASVSAAPIVLDFETAAKGSSLSISSLVTSAGMITLTNATHIGPTSAGSGNGVFHDELANPGFAMFSFDFDVSSISFTYSGQGFGVFTAEALDINGIVVDSFFDPDTLCCSPLGPVTLSAATIRSFRFADDPGGGDFSSVDNLSIDPAVPEPGTFGLASVAVVGIVWSRRRVNKGIRTVSLHSGCLA